MLANRAERGRGSPSDFLAGVGIAGAGRADERWDWNLLVAGAWVYRSATRCNSGRQRPGIFRALDAPVDPLEGEFNGCCLWATPAGDISRNESGRVGCSDNRLCFGEHDALIHAGMSSSTPGASKGKNCRRHCGQRYFASVTGTSRVA